MDLIKFKGENNINTGPLKEIPEICIDHFVGDDLKSTTFFLTHAHTDHMVGLETKSFLKRLYEHESHKLYCHVITIFLLKGFTNTFYLGGDIDKLVRDKKLIPLDTGSVIELEIRSSNANFFVNVTLLPGGHCPGSVMFLFERKSMNILYTGDCRLTEADLKRMELLHDTIDGERKIKDIFHLYIDTTFCSQSADFFPKREYALEKAFDAIKNWINDSPQNVVQFSFSAKFAHEFVITEIYKRFQKKVHVNSMRYEIYKKIPGLDDCVTIKSNSTPFHLCFASDCSGLVVSRDNIMKIRLSAIWYTMKNKNRRDLIRIRGKNNITICYSMHSSLTEISQMIDYVRPKNLTPLVHPIGSTLIEIEDALLEKCNVNFNFVDYQTKSDMHLMESDSESDSESESDNNSDSDKDEVIILSDDNSQPEESFAKRPKLDCSIQNTNENKTSPVESNSQKFFDYHFSPSPKKLSYNSSRESSQELTTNSQ